MSWVWVLSFTVLGTQSEHGEQAKFDTKQACEQALTEFLQNQAQRGRAVAATCFLRRQAGQGWW